MLNASIFSFSSYVFKSLLDLCQDRQNSGFLVKDFVCIVLFVTYVIILQVDAKCNTYNNLAYNLKLIPLSAENSSGIDFELKKITFSGAEMSDFASIIKVKPFLIFSMCEIFMPPQNNSFRVYTGISPSVHVSICVSVSVSVCTKYR